MGAVEDAVDAAANFIGPFVDKNRKYSAEVPTDTLVEQALVHLQAINTADLAADPNAPYDASLAGVVYGLVDLVTILAVVPRLSSGVAFSQRPRSVLTAVIFTPPNHNLEALATVIEALLPMLEQKGSGLQPLLSQRILPDIISALVELSYSPTTSESSKLKYSKVFERIMKDTPTSRLLPILTTFLQQPLPTWLKPAIASELSSIPLRTQGIRHTIEFLSLSYLSKNSHVPQGASGPQSQIPIPLEAVSQASKLLVLPPSGISQDEWLMKISPELLHLLDGKEGKELSRAAGQIIAGGILSKKTTGAPGTTGWETFAKPLFQAIFPKNVSPPKSLQHKSDQTIVQEDDLKIALRRLKTIMSSYSHGGLIRRLIHPIILPLWAVLNYAKDRTSLDKEWSMLPSLILSRYMEIACDTKQIDNIATNLFWDGDTAWTFGPGSQGGVEIRTRSKDKTAEMGPMESIFERISDLDNRVTVLVTLFTEANISDDTAGSIFVNATKRWLVPNKLTTKSLTDYDSDADPLSALVDAKLSEALAQRFQEHFARSPQHIIELMAQLIQNHVSEHKTRVEKSGKLRISKRAMLNNIVLKQDPAKGREDGEATDEDLVSFALSILITLLGSSDLKKTPSLTETLHELLPSLAYLSQPQPQAQPPISSMTSNSATTALHLIAPTPTSTPSIARPTTDPLTEHRDMLKTCLTELQSPDPPNRTWALNTVHKLLNDPFSFPALDIPSLTHTILSASLADPESYVHLAAIPVLVTLAMRAPNPVVGILVDAFIDIDERSLKLARGKQTDEKERELRDALDFRLRVGEVLSTFVSSGDNFWDVPEHSGLQYRCAKRIVEACLSLASRRGQRNQTLSARTEVADNERKIREEGEAAWGGPIPNILEPEGADPQQQAEYEALQKIVGGWEDTGIEEDVRIRASALSVLSAVLEHRSDVLRQPMIDATLQMVLLIFVMEKEEAKALLRRSAVLVIMGLLRGIDVGIESGRDSAVGLDLKQQGEVERIVKWVRDEDADELVRDHAANVAEGLETIRMKKLYKIRDEGRRLGPDLGLEGNLRGLNVQPQTHDKQGKKKMIIEEIE
ncbi:uncharacterized protein ALTATR162_LOCUS4494 [Alternaria atra]|uniref:RNA polymerase II assembly factor Rtp1 C-terminal domain-containing protein n=1 Tax=Alternaria atra TaxID=119953 RepID=A0A8J2MZ64_9PLEO|nr:uncharacterized protein ALTATR162_LOCUS4494 [Alternaria atra]CAG5156697.1 unnamed protein product [Alternaria atra]